MKFVTLALALLLAVAAQAAPAAVAPAAVAPLDHARSVVDMGLTNMKESLKRALAQLDGTDFAEQGKKLTQQLDEAHLQLKAYQAQVKPNTDQAFATLSEMTAAARAEIQADIDKMKAELAPKEKHLKEVVNKHIEEYRAMLEPVITEHQKRHAAEMVELKSKLEPVMNRLQVSVDRNVEETKQALLPILQIVREGVSARVTQLHEATKPYIQEYRDEMEKMGERLKNIDPAALGALKLRLDEKAENVRLALTQFFGELVGSLQML